MADTDKTQLGNNELDISDSMEPITNARLWLSCRLSLSLIGFLGFLNVYALRINMSVAIVCMVNQTAVFDISSGAAETNHTLNGTDNEDCPITSNSANTDGEFVWSKQLQGIILGSFFYGYIATQILGGWLSGRYGGKRIYGYFMLVTIAATLLIPVGAKTSPILLIVLRIITGLGEGVVFPAMSTLWAQWAPPGERAMLISITYAGAQFGNVLTLPLAGILCQSGFAGGWPSVFYVFGMFGLVWFVLWMALVYDSPAQHPRITRTERDYIERSLGATIKPVLKTPWRKLLTSVPVLCIAVAHVCVTWGVYTLLTNIPTFMREVLKFDIKSNGLFSAIPYVAFGVMAFTSGIISDKLLERGMSVVNTRKLCYSLGCLVPGLFLVATGYVSCHNPYLGVALLTVAMAFSGFQFPGFTTNCVDIAPPFAGIIFGITNTIATLSGIVAPYVISVITVDQTPSQWRGVFYLAAAIYLLGTINFTILARGDVMEWVKPYMDCTNHQLQHDVMAYGEHNKGATDLEDTNDREDK